MGSRNFVKQKIAKDLGGYLVEFEDSVKFRQQLGALQLTKRKQLKSGKINESELKFFERRINVVKKLF